MIGSYSRFRKKEQNGLTNTFCKAATQISPLILRRIKEKNKLEAHWGAFFHQVKFGYSFR